MTGLLEYALLVQYVCLLANAITGLSGRADPERRLRNALPALILAAAAFAGYAVLTS